MTPDGKERYAYLAKKWLEGTLTSDEEVEYNTWYELAPKDDQIIEPEQGWSEWQLKERMFQEIKEQANIPSSSNDQLHEEKAIHTTSGRYHIRLNKSAKLFLKLAAVIVLSVLIYKGLRENGFAVKQPESRLVFENKLKQQDAQPDSDKAILQLADGRTLILDSQSNGLLANQGSIDIIKTKQGGLLYRSNTARVATKPDLDKDLLYNTLITPRGAKFQITLSDGTSIWLNAASSIRFPTKFDIDKRDVNLKGEAYFEVAKLLAKPFVVHTNEMEIKVKGTHFNVNAYEDDGTLRTTLLEGAVQVRAVRDTIHERSLMPGKEAIVDHSGQIQIRQANTDQAIAWKNGLFQFEKTDLRALLKEISRWYNIDVELKGPGSKDLFTGTIPRSIKLSALLSVLDYSNIKFKLNGNKLVVYTAMEDDHQHDVS